MPVSPRRWARRSRGRSPRTLHARRAPAGGLERGDALVEAALTLPVLLMVALAVVQFSLYAHARHVVAAAAQEGARTAAVEGGSLEEGVAYAQELLRAGLGRHADEVALRATDDGQVVTVSAGGQLRMVIPWVADAGLPLSAHAAIVKERFRPGGS